MKGAAGETMKTREKWALDDGVYVPDKRPGEAARRVVEDTATSPAKAPPGRTGSPQKEVTIP